MKEVYVKTRQKWRDWLAKHYCKEQAGIWLVFYKKAARKPSLVYEEAVEEALCFGWIDSIIKRKDGARFVRKFTPRKADSVWSELNKRRVAKLVKEGRMTPIGLNLVRKAKASGMWDKDARPDIDWSVPGELLEVFEENPQAEAFFEQLAPSYQKHYIGWIQSAKRPDTRAKRVRESIALLARRQKLGLK